MYIILSLHKSFQTFISNLSSLTLTAHTSLLIPSSSTVPSPKSLKHHSSNTHSWQLLPMVLVAFEPANFLKASTLDNRKSLLYYLNSCLVFHIRDNKFFFKKSEVYFCQSLLPFHNPERYGMTTEPWHPMTVGKKSPKSHFKSWSRVCGYDISWDSRCKRNHRQLKKVVLLLLKAIRFDVIWF